MYQVDAFAERVFEGNPAAVCPLQQWPGDSLLQAIAEENNLSETAFFAPAGEAFKLRWFTPLAEVDLCGHATLASAHVLYRQLGYAKQQIRFLTRSGQLTVERTESGLSMNFPAEPSLPCESPAALSEGLGLPPCEVLAGPDYVAIYESEAQVRALSPDFAQLQQLERRGVVVTAPGETDDFISRCFFPKLGVNEDPVTGSAHCQLAPYWAARFGRSHLVARQLSRRGGSVGCTVNGQRVILTGRAVDFMQAEITIEEP